MKYCEEYAALLDLYVDGELTAEEMERVRAHLEDCPGCQAYVDDVLAIRAGFPDAESTVVPEGFAGGVMERIRQDARKNEKTAERPRRHIWCWAGTAAMAACCALVILAAYNGGMSDGSAPAAVTMEAAVEEPNVRAFAGEDAPAAQDSAEIEKPAAPKEEVRQTAGAGEEKTRSYANDVNGGEAEEGCGNDPMLAAAAPMENASVADLAPAAEKEAALYLTAGEAGDLLDRFSPVWEDGEERCYELTAEEYRELTKALGRPEEPALTEEKVFLVVVTAAEE